MILLSKNIHSSLLSKRIFFLCILMLINALLSLKIYAITVNVNSVNALQNAINNASNGDILILANGTYLNNVLNITTNAITVKAQSPGGVFLNGTNDINISGNNITFTGFQFTSGDIGSSYLLEVSGNDVVLSHLNINGYFAKKYISLSGQRDEVSYCNFENKPALAVSGNLIQIAQRSDLTPNYAKIRYCSFQNMLGNGGDFGNECIRITNHEIAEPGSYKAKTIIEFCYFSNTGLGDSEAISVKSDHNIIRYNTMVNNQKANFCFRYGDDNVAYGNFFINSGGIRIKESNNIYCYNNYFENCGDGSVTAPVKFQYDNSSTVPHLNNLNFVHNTFVGGSFIELGAYTTPNNGGVTVTTFTNNTWANNIFKKTSGNIFSESVLGNTFLGNIYDGVLGITVPSGMTNANPQLALNSNNYYGLLSNSPAIDAANATYPAILDINNIDDDPNLLLDISGQTRPSAINLKDVGCDEYTTGTKTNHPLTLSEVGPSYLAAAVLPINLLSFSISKRNGQATLLWSTATEQNNSHFDIERSTDGINFTKIDQVKGAGNSSSIINYAYADKNLSSGTNYYRLKQVDFDRNETFSPIQAVTFAINSLRLTSSFVNDYLEVSSNNDQESTIYIYTNSGQKVLEIKSKGVQQINVSALSAGVYLLKTAAGDAVKFIKQ